MNNRKKKNPPFLHVSSKFWEPTGRKQRCRAAGGTTSLHAAVPRKQRVQHCTRPGKKKTKTQNELSWEMRGARRRRRAEARRAACVWRALRGAAGAAWQELWGAHPGPGAAPALPDAFLLRPSVTRSRPVNEAGSCTSSRGPAPPGALLSAAPQRRGSAPGRTGGGGREKRSAHAQGLVYPARSCSPRPAGRCRPTPRRAGRARRPPGGACALHSLASRRAANTPNNPRRRRQIK